MKRNNEFELLAEKSSSDVKGGYVHLKITRCWRQRCRRRLQVEIYPVRGEAGPGKQARI